MFDNKPLDCLGIMGTYLHKILHNSDIIKIMNVWSQTNITKTFNICLCPTT